RGSGAARVGDRRRRHLLAGSGQAGAGLGRPRRRDARAGGGQASRRGQARGEMIGVLALQGGFDAHVRALGRQDVRLVRAAAHFAGLDGLVLPGGESPVMLRLLARHGLWRALAAARGLPTLATCAGLILAARTVEPAQPSLGWLDVAVARNAWGRQL